MDNINNLVISIDSLLILCDLSDQLLFLEGFLGLMFASKKIRVLCGGLLLCAGYFPSFLGLLPTSSSYPCYNEILGDLLVLSYLPNGDGLSSSFIEKCINSSLGSNLALHDFPYTVPVADIVSDNGNPPAVVAIQNIHTIKMVNIAGYQDARVVTGQITSSFYADAKKSGTPACVVDCVAKTMHSKLNFRRSLKPGDRFEILFSQKNELIYAKITTKKKTATIYRVPKNDGKGYIYCSADGAPVGYHATATVTSTLESTDVFAQPLRGKLVVSDRFGPRRHPITGKMHHHEGTDLRAKHGTDVYAVSDGVITRSSYYAGYGKCIDIKHQENCSSRYAHLSHIMVCIGQKVIKGQKIGKVGSTGHSTGCHLHLEYARNNKNQDWMAIRASKTLEKKTVVERKVEKSQVNMSYFHNLKNGVASVFEAS